MSIKHIYKLMLHVTFGMALFNEIQGKGLCEKCTNPHTAVLSKISTFLSCFSDYLGNVLEDLGFSLSDHLQQVSTLLRLSPEEYQTKSSGCSPRLVAAVRQMRNITSSG
jgi:hypothetical protein